MKILDNLLFPFLAQKNKSNICKLFDIFKIPTMWKICILPPQNISEFWKSLMQSINALIYHSFFQHICTLSLVVLSYNDCITTYQQVIYNPPLKFKHLLWEKVKYGNFISFDFKNCLVVSHKQRNRYFKKISHSTHVKKKSRWQIPSNILCTYFPIREYYIININTYK